MHVVTVWLAIDPSTPANGCMQVVPSTHKAGPVAQRAAEMTADAGQKLAARSRDLAADLRRDMAADGESPTTMDAETTEMSEEPKTADVM